VAHRTRPANRSEQEIAGYRDVLQTIHTHPQNIALTPAVVLQLHRDLFRFVPGGGGPATVNGFASVFSDVDQPNGSGPATKRGNRHASTLIEYYGINGELLYSSFVPASPGDGGFSFFGVVFPDARIARVRITSGDVAPGPTDSEKDDVVMMDDFIFGEPHSIQ